MSELARPDESGTTTETTGESSEAVPMDQGGSEGGASAADAAFPEDPAAPKKRRRRGSRGGRGRKRPGAGASERSRRPWRAEDDDTASRRGLDRRGGGSRPHERGPGRRRARGRRHPRPPQRRCSAGRRSPPRSRGRGQAPHRRLPARTAEPVARPGSRTPTPLAAARRRSAAAAAAEGADGVEAAATELRRPPRLPALRPVNRHAAREAPLTSTPVSTSPTSTSTAPPFSSRSIRRRSTAGGGPAARAVPPAATSWSCTNVTTAWRTSACSRAAASSSTTSPCPPTTRRRSTATSISVACRTCCRGWKPLSSTSGRPRTACCTEVTSCTTRPTSTAAKSRRASNACCGTASRSSCRSRRTRSAHKGARLTQEVSLAGRFVVMVPNQPQTYGISKRLPDDERKRLRRVLDRLRPSDAGLIVRTAAEGATDEELERDMRGLNAQWKQISDIAKNGEAGQPPLQGAAARDPFDP